VATKNSNQKIANLQNLEKLVDELLKTHPSDARVREYMREAGLNYTSDPVECMSLVMKKIDSLRTVRRERLAENS
jgi:hypothetical protein